MRFVLVTISVALVLGSAAVQPVLGDLVDSLTGSIGNAIDTTIEIVKNAREYTGDVVVDALDLELELDSPSKGIRNIFQLLLDLVLLPVVEQVSPEDLATVKELGKTVDDLLKQISSIIPEVNIDIGTVCKAITNTVSDVKVEQS